MSETTQNESPRRADRLESELLRHLFNLGSAGEEVRTLMNHEWFAATDPKDPQVGEMRANLMLVCRHFEDARMRLRKVLQAKHSGVSSFGD